MNRLVSTSLIQRLTPAPFNKAHRYTLHPLIRQYAAEQLKKTGEADKQHKTHAFYFAKRLRQHLDEWEKHQEEQQLETIARSSEDMRAAWNWHLTQPNRTAEAIDPLVRHLSYFYTLRGRHPENIQLCERSLRHFPPSTENKMPQAEWIRLAIESHSALGQKIYAQQKIYAALTHLGYPPPTTSFQWRKKTAALLLRAFFARPHPVPPAQQDHYRTLSRLYHRFMLVSYFENDRDKTAYAALNTLFASFRLNQPAAETAVAQSVMYGLWLSLKRASMAEQAHQEALALIAQLNIPHTSGIVKGTLATWEDGHHPWSEVRQSYKEAINLLTRTKDRRTRDDMYTSLTYLYLIHGEWDEFLVGNQKIYDSGLESDNHEHIGWCILGRCMLLIRQDRWVEAQHNFLMLSDLIQQHQLSQITAVATVTHLALIHAHQQEWEKAADFADRASHLMAQTADISFAAVDAYICLTETRLLLWEQTEQSGDNTKAAHKAARQIMNEFQTFAQVHPLGRASFARSQGWQAMLENKPTQAHNHWQEGIKTAQTQQLPYDEHRLRTTRLRLSSPNYPNKRPTKNRLNGSPQNCKRFARHGKT